MTDVSARSRFVNDVARVFEGAGVVRSLHGYGTASPDSDVDLAVTRESLSTVDLLLTCGRLGRLLQRLDYDIPWCRYYAIETGEAKRRYRQVDVACDPRGIGRYGPALRVVLANTHLVDGLRIPEPAAEAFYLIVKRAKKEPGPRNSRR